MPKQRGGGSIGQSLKYVDPAAPEQSAGAGSNLLVQDGYVVRPAIGGGSRKKRGGFYPSVMAGVVENGLVMAPLAAFAARKLLTRKGGAAKGNLWRAQQENAKAALAAYGKPTAQNIVRYAAAKRKGTEPANEYMGQFRKRVQEKAEAIQAAKESRKIARNAKRAEKKAETKTRKNMEKAMKQESKAMTKAEKEAAKAMAKAGKEAAKAAKALERAQKAETKKAAKKEKAPKTKKMNLTANTELVFENNGTVTERAPSKREMLREAEANAAAAKAAMKKNLKDGQTAWKELVETAKARLATEGTPTLKDAMQLASLMKKGENTANFLNKFRVKATTAKVNKKVTAKVNKKVTAKVKKTNTVKANTVKTNTVKKHTNKSLRYFDELSKARTFLGTVGAPTGPNMAKYASMMVKGANKGTVNSWLNNFKTRRPLSMAKPKAVAKGKGKGKALTAIAEASERKSAASEDSMQGYSEDFEDEEPETDGEK